MGETVPGVLSTARGRRPRAVLISPLDLPFDRETFRPAFSYRAKNQVVMFCFGLQSIARFINTDAT